jgi:hypothetical protein
LFYNILSTCDWSDVYETSSVDAAIVSLNTVARDAMEHAVSRDYNS